MSEGLPAASPLIDKEQRPEVALSGGKARAEGDHVRV